MSKRYWEKPITLRLTPYQRKVLSEIVDGAADAGACKGGLTQPEQKALLSIHMRLIGATAAQAKTDAAYDAAEPPKAVAREALEHAEGSFEAIRLMLINHLKEPERKAFWEAVAGRDAARAALAQAEPDKPAIGAPPRS